MARTRSSLQRAHPTACASTRAIASGDRFPATKAPIVFSAGQRNDDILAVGGPCSRAGGVGQPGLDLSLHLARRGLRVVAGGARQGQSTLACLRTRPEGAGERETSRSEVGAAGRVS